MDSQHLSGDEARVRRGLVGFLRRPSRAARSALRLPSREFLDNHHAVQALAWGRGVEWADAMFGVGGAIVYIVGHAAVLIALFCPVDLNIAGNAALIPASSSGLGKACAKALAREGVNVVINGRNEDRLAEAVRDVEAIARGEVVAQTGDITEPDDIDALVETTLDTFGRLDHLVTNAGGPPSGPFRDTTDEDWYDAYELLVMSVVRLVRACADALRADGGGTVVTITSRSVKEAIDSLVLSNSVRMSVIGLEKTLSEELAPEVRANAVLPGSHETARLRELVEQAVDRGDYESYEAGIEDWAGNPLGRIGDPMELGDTVAFLSSPKAGYINGAAIPVDGGSCASNL